MSDVEFFIIILIWHTVMCVFWYQFGYSNGYKAMYKNYEKIYKNK